MGMTRPAWIEALVEALPHEFSPLAGNRRGFDGIADQCIK